MTLQCTELKIKNLYKISFHKVKDNRGEFSRLFCINKLKELGINFNINQISICNNDHLETLRGLHYQTPPYEEQKIVKCIKGNVFDVVVDLRINSPTYAQFECINLSADINEVIYIPPMCAHGYINLTPESTLLYFIDQEYMPRASTGIHWQSPFLAIPWPTNNPIISDKDQDLPFFNDIKYKAEEING